MRIGLILLLSCCLLCACGGERDAPLEVQVPAAPEEQGPFQTPPPLLVGGQTEALVGSYCWGTAALAEEMGEMVMICADAVHPLDIPELSPAVAYPLEPGQEGVLTLSWPAEPDEVFVSYWPMEDLAAEVYAAEQTVEELPLSYESGRITVPPEDLPCMVMVTADWQEGTLIDCFGYGYYSFQVVPAQ